MGRFYVDFLIDLIDRSIISEDPIGESIRRLQLFHTDVKIQRPKRNLYPILIYWMALIT